MKNYKLTLVGLAISVIVLLGTIIFDLDLSESVVEYMQKFERFELDEFTIPTLIATICALIDLTRKQKFQKIEIEKIKIYKAMLSSTHHILNNFLNQIQLLKMTAEDNDESPHETLALYDQITKDAQRQIEALGSVTSVDEASISASVAPQSITKKHSG